MSNTEVDPESLHHHKERMGGRDPHEENRAATPLELLFDLTFVIAFGLAASKFAHGLSQGHFVAALIGMAFAGFGMCWAWINFSWFASAYDTDDWIFRLVTMVQMVGVLVFALGLPRMFDSVEHGEHLDIRVLVSGYVIMRIALVFQWIRAAKQDRERRAICLTYAGTISIAQIGWVLLIIFQLPLIGALISSVLLMSVEMAGPYFAERQGDGTPWHAHHIAERYSLFAIIAMGEGVVGTVATISAVVEKQGWSMAAALVAIAGTGLTFGMWWVYYTLPSGPILHAHRDRSFVWGYGQMLIVTSIVATGAGLHVAANYIEREAHIGALQAVLCVATPVGTYLGLIYGMYYYLVQRFDPMHVWLLLATAAVVALAIYAAASGVAMSWCLIILMFAPAVTVFGYEKWGHRHQARVLLQDAAD